MDSDLGTIAIPAALNDWLQHAAAAVGQTASEVALRAIEEYVGDLEDARIARQRIMDIREGRSDTVTLAELLGRHGLAD